MSLAPRADFACARCGKPAGAEVVYENLPVASQRCPVCGAKRGFKRLYNGIQVSTKGHRIAKALDPMVGPEYDRQVAVRDQARASEKRLRDAHEEMTAKVGAPPPTPLGRFIPASAALGMIDPAARADSRTFIWPHVKRRVQPHYEHR